jgi:hypothetical protein
LADADRRGSGRTVAVSATLMMDKASSSLMSGNLLLIMWRSRLATGKHWLCYLKKE